MASRNWSKQTLLKRLVQTMIDEGQLDSDITVDDVVTGKANADLEAVTALDVVVMLKAAIVKEALR